VKVNVDCGGGGDEAQKKMGEVHAGLIGRYFG
jgi:hypothetical protein